MNQYEVKEEELLNEKKFGKESIEHYLKVEPKVWWKNKECHHSRKFLESIENLGKSSGSLSKYQEVVKTVNDRFINNVILKGLKTLEGHKFNKYLSFFCSVCKKFL